MFRRPKPETVFKGFILALFLTLIYAFLSFIFGVHAEALKEEEIKYDMLERLKVEKGEQLGTIEGFFITKAGDGKEMIFNYSNMKSGAEIINIVMDFDVYVGEKLKYDPFTGKEVGRVLLLENLEVPGEKGRYHNSDIVFPAEWNNCTRIEMRVFFTTMCRYHFWAGEDYVIPIPINSNIIRYTLGCISES